MQLLYHDPIDKTHDKNQKISLTKMPPCTPEKYCNEDVRSSGTQFGFTTPPRSVTVKKSSREEQHIRWLLTKLPTVARLFDVERKIGEGTFSAVFLGTMKDNPGREFALKHLVPTTHPKRIEVELHCLRQIGGVDNVIGLDLCVRENDNIVLVTPYMKYDSFLEYAFAMDADELRAYMTNLLRAIARVHSFGIIHRDIKPNNFLYDRETRRFLLIDFGLAQLSQTENESGKRKRDESEDSEPARKRRALLMKNIYNLTDTVSHLETCSSGPVLRRSPRKHVSKNSPFKPPKEPTRARGKRKLFEDAPKPTAAPAPRPEHCRCYAKPYICNMCIVRKAQEAPRAGTPGFRPPEVLLKHPHQTTAVDVWAAGIVMLCVLSRTYPFFKAPDDVTALAEIISVFGDEPVKRLAKQFGKKLLCSERKPTLNLRRICDRLRNRGSQRPAEVACAGCGYGLCVCDATCDFVDPFPDEAYDLLGRLLDVDPATRIAARDALSHPFLCS